MFTHSRTQPSLNSTDALITPCFRNDVERVLVHPLGTLFGELSLQLHPRLRNLSRVRDRDLEHRDSTEKSQSLVKQDVRPRKQPFRRI